MGPQPNLDAVGWTWIGLAIGWTVFLASGMLFLVYHRQLPSLQLRRLPLVFAAVTLLHIYAFICMIGYVIIPFVPCSAEFWIMSIYLPCGIALLQAANSQFLHVASQQRKFAHLSNLDDRIIREKPTSDHPTSSRWKQVTQRIWTVDKITRMTIFIAIGLFLQFSLTLFVFFGSKKFHPGYGIFNVTLKGTAMEQRMQCDQGWEWWLSIVWQFFWAWIYAPYVLWKARGIHDTHGWRIQTICCCLAGLPASPMWLVALYAPAMAPVNQYFIPPQWFSVSIFLIEVITIGIPCWQVIKSHNLRQETLDAIASWEKRNQEGGTIASDSAKSTDYSGTTFKSGARSATSKATADSRKSDMFTMVALENALRTNADPLLRFAALKDFSGENVSFLTHIAHWKSGWTPSKSPSEGQLLRQQFIRAVRIYSSFVSLEYSEFPINISSKGFRQLHDIFEASAALLNRSKSVQSDSVTPFDRVSAGNSTSSLKNVFDLEGLGQANLESVTNMTELTGDGLENVPIPPTFSPQVFDYAEAEIKYLVLTNTWPKFVNAGFADYTDQRRQSDLFGYARKFFGWREIA